VVAIAGDENEFVAEMEKAVRRDSSLLQAKRQAIAAQNTWDQRVAQISTIIEDCLEERQSPRTGVTGSQKESA